MLRWGAVITTGVLLPVLGLAPAATAGTVVWNGSNFYAGAAGETLTLTPAANGGALTSPTGVTVAPVPPNAPAETTCLQSTSTSAVCPAAGGPLTIQMSTGAETVDAGTLNSLPVLILMGQGDDHVTGPLAGTVIDGGDGDDTLTGGPQKDAVVGGNGDDHVLGGDGDDQLVGGAGTDDLQGGPGKDTIDGGTGADTVQAGDGDDMVKVNDATKDVVDCGPGADSVEADPLDVLTGCETITGPASAPPGSGTPKVTPTFKFQVKDKTSEGVLVKKLEVGGLTAGDAVSVACKGKDCPFKTTTGKVASGKSKLTKLFKKHRVKKVTLTVTVTRTGAIGVVETLKLKKGKVRTSTQCLAPGSTSPTIC